MKSATVILVAMLATSCLGVSAQGGYHYGYGGSRVVNQDQTGLYHPSGTYIGSGTMSRSAQGLPSGVSSGGMSNGLPVTKMGASVGTPGDNQYGDAAQWDRHGVRRRPVFRSPQYCNQQNQNPNLHYYVPGQNGGGIQQGQFVDPRCRSNAGAASYAEADQYNVKGNGAFHY